MPDFIAYYRVSTDRQGRSGLGLDAQRASAARHMGDVKPLAEFTEVESGKRHENRPELKAALDECRRRKAVLLIASLDRLARNVHFISGLMESAVPFIAVDMPSASPFEIHIRAAMAEEERRKISQRTKAALAEAKRRGTRLGNPRIEEARVAASKVHRSRRPAAEVLALMTNWREQGWTYLRVAEELNRLSIRPSRGRQWYGSSVRNCLLMKETMND